MTTSTKYSAQQLLEFAISIQEAARTNYLTAASLVQDGGVRPVLERLAENKAKEGEYLGRVLGFLKRVRGWPDRVDVPRDLLVAAHQDLFRRTKDLPVESYNSVVRAIRRAIQLEVDSIEVCRELSTAAEDQAARNELNDLVVSGQDHLFVLNYWLRQIERQGPTPKSRHEEKPTAEVARITMATDPACGMEIDPKTAVAEEAYQGRTYYFCSHVCQEKFKAEPEKYVTG